MASVTIWLIGRISTSAEENRACILNNFPFGIDEAKVPGYLKGPAVKYF